MQRKYMILPNAILTACAVILFYRSFFSGHITWIGSLVTLAPLAALAHCVSGKTPRILNGVAAILNAVLFFACGYAFVGTASMLAKTGILDGPFFPVVGVLWAASLGMILFRRNRPGVFCAWSVNMALAVMGMFALHARAASGWRPWMTAALFAALIAVAGLNVCLLGIFPVLHRYKKM